LSLRHKEDSLVDRRVGRLSVKEAKLAEIAAACEAAVFAGVDVETSRGVEHFSLTFSDQANIAGLVLRVRDGDGSGVLYHADGELCRVFGVDEVNALSAAAERHKVYHTTLCNHYNVWIRRCEDDDEVGGIVYGADLPGDLAESMMDLVGGF
jgi:hypothetical protein